MTWWPAAFGHGLFHGDTAPPGTNNRQCKPTAERPRPVILLHDTWMNAYNGFAYMSRPITDAGPCTIVGTRYDEITDPDELTSLSAGPGATVHNITRQDGCEQDLSDHLTIMYSPRALDPPVTPPWRAPFNPWLPGGGGKL